MSIDISPGISPGSVLVSVLVSVLIMSIGISPGISSYHEYWYQYLSLLVSRVLVSALSWVLVSVLIMNIGISPPYLSSIRYNWLNYCNSRYYRVFCPCYVEWCSDSSAVYQAWGQVISKDLSKYMYKYYKKMEVQVLLIEIT